jgi:hypothetical protein
MESGAPNGIRAARLWEICEDRYQSRSKILTSQLPISKWHEQIGDPILADGILDLSCVKVSILQSVLWGSQITPPTDRFTRDICHARIQSV